MRLYELCKKRITSEMLMGPIPKDGFGYAEGRTLYTFF